MPAPVSIVIPTLNAAAGLPRCLEALMEAVAEGLIREVIFTDGGSQDKTLEIAEACGALLVSGPASRGGQLKRGCAVANGEWLLVLHADTCLKPGWAQVVSAHIKDKNSPVACFRLTFDSPVFAASLVAGWANWRSRWFGLPYGDQGLLIRSDHYQNCGGFNDQPLMEDVDLVRRVGRITILTAVASTSAEKYLREGWITRGFRNLTVLLRYFLGVSPEKLSRIYQKKA